MNGLIHPTDLDAWRSWHESRHPVRSAARTLSKRGRGETAPMELLSPPTAAALLVCIEATHASVRNAVASTLTHLPVESTAVLCPSGWVAPDGYDGHVRLPVSAADLPQRVPRIRAALATGHFTAIGSVGHETATLWGAPFYVSQHGALTSFAPPLPPDSHLLAWSTADADFWISERHDIQQEVVGSQLLWNAATRPEKMPPSPTAGTPAPITYLGQMHGAELSRSRLARAAGAFCREHGAVYRPHPSERDKISQLTHALYRRAGIRFDASAQLADLRGPVVSVFSTGVLEAASQGRDAWVDFPCPPAWLEEFWERYDMHRFGDVPTPPPARPAEEPARRIAQILVESVS